MVIPISIPSGAAFVTAAIHYGLEECMEICHIEVNIFLEETEENLHILHLKLKLIFDYPFISSYMPV